MCRISIIVPVYNGERYLRFLLDSILAQSYSEWECICVNDSSTDGSLAILEDYAAHDNRFKCFTKPNGGTGAARNFGLEHATGDYIMFADQDDALHTDAMKLAKTGIEKANSDVLQFERCAFVTTPKWGTADDCLNKLVRMENPLEAYLATGSLVIYVWQYIYKKEILDNIRFPELTGGEDSPFIFDVANSTCNWAKLPAALYGFRENLSSVSRSIPIWYIDNGFKACELIFEHGKGFGVDEVRLCKRTTHDAFYFALSIVLRHGRGKRGKENLVAVSEKLSRTISNGTLALDYLTAWQRMLVKALVEKRYFVLRGAAYTLGYFVSLIKWLLARV